MEYTRKEKAAIDAAYTYLEYLAGYDMGGPGRLHECLKYEKAGRDGLTIAKLLLVENAWRGVENFRDGQELTASELYRFSRGCAYARMFGGDLARRAAQYGSQEDYGRSFIKSVNDFCDRAALSDAAGDQARERWLNRTNDLLKAKLAEAEA